MATIDNSATTAAAAAAITPLTGDGLELHLEDGLELHLQDGLELTGSFLPFLALTEVNLVQLNLERRSDLEREKNTRPELSASFSVTER